MEVISIEITLKAAILSKFGSASKFGREVGWSGRKAREITSGRQDPTADDMAVIAKALEISNQSDFMSLFFPHLSTKWIERQ